MALPYNTNCRKKKKKKNQMWCFAQFGTFVQSRMLERLSNVKNMKNVKNTHGEVIVLLKLQTSACNFTKSITPPWVFSPFLNCTNSTKSRKASQIFILPKTLCKNLGLKRYKKKSRQLSFSLVFIFYLILNRFLPKVLFLTKPASTKAKTQNKKTIIIIAHY